MRHCVARESACLIAAALLVDLLFAITVIPIAAQPAGSHPFYDISKEQTISGAVSNVLASRSQGTLPGAHLLVSTPTGVVDASLGRWGLQGKGAVSVHAGQQIEVTGVMKTIREQQVFVARTVKVGSRVYVIRNEHGIAVSPLARERMANQAAQKGDSL